MFSFLHICFQIEHCGVVYERAATSILAWYFKHSVYIKLLHLDVFSIMEVLPIIQKLGQKIECSDTASLICNRMHLYGIMHVKNVKNHAKLLNMMMSSGTKESFNESVT